MKYSMKLEHCKTIAFECLIKDTMRIDDSPYILTEEGLEYFSKKYKNEMHKLFKNVTEKTYETQMKKQEE